jgi:hypothetical protein
MYLKQPLEMMVILLMFDIINHLKFLNNALCFNYFEINLN